MPPDPRKSPEHEFGRAAAAQSLVGCVQAVLIVPLPPSPPLSWQPGAPREAGVLMPTALVMASGAGSPISSAERAPQAVESTGGRAQMTSLPPTHLDPPAAWLSPAAAAPASCSPCFLTVTAQLCTQVWHQEYVSFKLQMDAAGLPSVSIPTRRCLGGMGGTGRWQDRLIHQRRRAPAAPLQGGGAHMLCLLGRHPKLRVCTAQRRRTPSAGEQPGFAVRGSLWRTSAVAGF